MYFCATYVPSCLGLDLRPGSGSLAVLTNANRPTFNHSWNWGPTGLPIAKTQKTLQVLSPSAGASIEENVVLSSIRNPDYIQDVMLISGY